MPVSGTAVRRRRLGRRGYQILKFQDLGNARHSRYAMITKTFFMTKIFHTYDAKKSS
jgi:hypothetical protein